MSASQSVLNFVRPSVSAAGLAAAALLTAGLWSTAASAQQAAASPTGTEAAPLTAEEAAVRFGSLEGVSDISLSPDGSQIAFIAPAMGQGNDLYVSGTGEGAAPRRILRASGDPEIFLWCNWATGTRIVCQTGSRERVGGDILGQTAIIAVDSVGGNVISLGARRSQSTVYADLRGGDVIDWLPQDPDGAVLMMRSYVPDTNVTSMAARNELGMGVDRVDVSSGAARRVEQPRVDAVAYMTDGQGSVRIMGTQPTRGQTGQLDEILRYFYRPAIGGPWTPLCTFNVRTQEGFSPRIVDDANNRVIGFSRVNGRTAVSSMSLDGSVLVTPIYTHDRVDVDELLLVGRSQRFVGVAFATDRRQSVIVDPRIRAMTTALGRALGGKQVYLIDASADESQYLVWAGSDVDPGTYYLFTPATRQLRPLLAERPRLARTALATVRSVSYPAADGTMIPGYLTLPPGREDARGLPAIVMPHGGPSARDEWGFDWLSQYFANQGYAVLQPNFRGSSGFGDQWYLDNGFQS